MGEVELLKCKLKNSNNLETLASNKKKNPDPLVLFLHHGRFIRGRGGDYREVAQYVLVVEEPGENLIDLFGKDYLVKLVTEAISKYPDFIKSVEKQVSLDPTPRRVEVICGNLPADLPALTSFYGKYGEIEECTAAYGCANILYKYRNSAREALKDPKPTAGMHLLPWCRPGREVSSTRYGHQQGIVGRGFQGIEL
ncbi:hypothetical protein Vadar_032562 [Vaccinium darrowii]|uniref:Uncharacterized protein n=1 Tax=Vaccinium darrowii TaxID=229202 RepID=A0ACB7Y4X0_9ERIC|nr:hypothetical protein Vadar_032562 [Vaccinium darrowii]